MRRKRTHKRWTGVVGIGDRVAFKMPGDDFITAGTIEDMDEHTMLLSRLACVPEETRAQVQMTVQQGLIVENKSELARRAARERRRERQSEQRKPTDNRT